MYSYIKAFITYVLCFFFQLSIPFMDYVVSCDSSLLVFIVVLLFDYTMSFITTDGGDNALFMLFFQSGLSQKVLLGLERWRGALEH